MKATRECRAIDMEEKEERSSSVRKIGSSDSMQCVAC